MKRFEAFKKDQNSRNQLIMTNEIAFEVTFDIIAETEDRALELLEEAGFDPDDFNLEEINCNKTQMGRDLAEGISNARLLPLSEMG